MINLWYFLGLPKSKTISEGEEREKNAVCQRLMCLIMVSLAGRNATQLHCFTFMCCCVVNISYWHFHFYSRTIAWICLEISGDHFLNLQEEILKCSTNIEAGQTRWYSSCKRQRCISINSVKILGKFWIVGIFWSPRILIWH